jgi:hypothetical protein
VEFVTRQLWNVGNSCARAQTIFDPERHYGKSVTRAGCRTITDQSFIDVFERPALDVLRARATRFSRWVDMTSKESAFADLKRSNALGRPETEKLTFDDSAAIKPA